jgi:Carboxypeptidase regulatory-like domain
MGRLSMSINRKNVHRRWITVLLGAIMMIVISGVDLAHLNGQGTTATISGRITDASGAAVTGAEIQVKNTGTGATQTALTDEQGRYTLADLLVGDYDLHVSKAGFSNMVRTGVTLTVGTQSVVDFALQGRDHYGGSPGFSSGHLQLDCGHADRPKADE